MLRRVFLLPLVLSLAASAATQLPADYAAKADELVHRYYDKGIFMGAVLVTHEGKPVYRKAYGMAQAEWSVPNSPEGRFRLGSVTKQFTAAAILQLVEQGKLSLTDPVSKFYTDAPSAWSQVTIHHLLTHTSGIPSYTSLPNINKLWRNRMTPAEILKLTQDQPLEFDPGTRYKYSNSGYVLLGYVIEKTSGQNYADYLQKNVLDRAGLKDTSYDVTEVVLPRRVAGYSGSTKQLRNASYLDMSTPFAAGGLYSTVDDLERWTQALEGGRVISAASFDKMRKPEKDDYGYGLGVAKLYQRVTYGHTGGIPGFAAALIRLPDEKLTIAVLANLDTAQTQKVAVGLAGLAFGEKVELPEIRPEVSVKPEILKEYVGRYQIRPQVIVSITLEDGRLITQAPNQGKVEVAPISETEFEPRGIPAKLTFLKENGKVTALTVEQNGRTMKATRLPE